MAHPFRRVCSACLPRLQHPGGVPTLRTCFKADFVHDSTTRARAGAHSDLLSHEELARIPTQVPKTVSRIVRQFEASHEQRLRVECGDGTMHFVRHHEPCSGGLGRETTGCGTTCLAEVWNAT